MGVVVFLGVKHCGKSTQGRLLAQKLGCRLQDSDDLMQLKYAAEYNVPPEEATPRKIMQRHGEEFFRRYEADIIREFPQQNGFGNTVLSLGGGVPDNPFLKSAEIKALGTLVYLQIDPDTAYERIAAGGIPPFLAGNDPYGKFLEICQKRMPRCKELADITIQVPENPVAQELADTVFNELKKRNVL